MLPSQSGRRSLKKYEIKNAVFFLFLIVALGVLVAFVFRSYETRDLAADEESGRGVISDSLSPSADIGAFYLGTRLSEANRQFRSRLEIPVTDDGLLRELFDLPGVESITLDRKVLMIKKNPSTRWEVIQPGVRRIVDNHLHTHY